MNKLEIIKDTEDKEHLIFTDSNLDEEINIGNKLEDFEILMLLGEGGFGKVLKVRSKLDNNIYAMKISDLQKIEKEKGKHSKDLALNREISFLPKLSHPHIIKYYTYFEKDSFLYIITEYIRNGDLCDLIDIHRELKKPFKEEELWNIFYQCMDSLLYIHKKGVIHRDIKPLNIFIDDNMKIKIGDFGISALNPSQFKSDKFIYSNMSYFSEQIEMLESHNTILGTTGYQAKEIEQGEYDQKIDVYSMGNSFFELLYLHSPLINSEEDQKLKYSETIKNIIYLMRQEDKKKRISSEKAYELIEEQYSKISKNSSIFSLITCLNSFEEFNNFLKKIKIPISSSKKIGAKTEKIERITDTYLTFLKFLDKENKAEKEWELNIKMFRKILSKQNLKFEGINEIKPSFLFTFIIEKIYEEYEEIKRFNNKRKKFFIDGLHLINSVEDSEKRKEGEARILFDNYFEETKSPIIKFFKGLIKQTNVCNKCNFITYSFSSYFFANFDLNELSKKKEITIFDLEENLKTENEFVKILYCDKCLKKQEHKCNKEYYTFPNLLVISLKRGIKTVNQTEVDLKEFIELKDLDKKENDKKKYQLVGLIKKISKTEEKEEQYYSNFYIDNHWFNYDKKRNIYQSYPPFENSKLSGKKGIHGGDIVMLFYIFNSK